MEHHAVAAVNIAGSGLDVLGSLYLAYDLLGGQHGPLRLLTRAVTYSLAFGIGYGLGLGLFFGVVAGVASGITIAVELNRAARGHDPIRCRRRACLVRFEAPPSPSASTLLWDFALPSPSACSRPSGN